MAERGCVSHSGISRSGHLISKTPETGHVLRLVCDTAALRCLTGATLSHDFQLLSHLLRLLRLFATNLASSFGGAICRVTLIKARTHMAQDRSKEIFDRYVPQIGVRPITELLSELMGDISRLLDVERVGYARLEADRSAIQREVQFHRSTRKCDTAGLPKLYAKDCPGYFAAILRPPGVVISHDVMRDERLKDFWEGYFMPLKVKIGRAHV